VRSVLLGSLAGGLLFTAVASFVLLHALEIAPRVDRAVVLTPEHVGRAKALLDGHRYRVRPGTLASARVRADDVDVAANYLARHLLGGSASVGLQQRRADVRLSLPLGARPTYLNVAATLVETAGVPRMEGLSVGALRIPDPVTAVLVRIALALLQRDAQARALVNSLQMVRMSAEDVSVVYRWTGGFHQDVQAVVLSEDDRQRLRHHQEFLAQWAQSVDGRDPSLPRMLQALLVEARGRAADGDAVAENRAALLVGMFHVLGRSPRVLIPEARAWPRVPRRTVTLDGRADLAKHFMVSAVIAAHADTALADVVGLYKELQDARGGSGFSFPDLAADRAGTRFGERAVTDPASAMRLQELAGGGWRDDSLMPAWRDLPEGLQEDAFRQRFGGQDTDAYREVAKEIERRLDALSWTR
jgi:hypothetical protein